MIVQADTPLPIDHLGWFSGVDRVPSPDFGGEISPVYLVLHYTASGTAQGAIDWLTKGDGTPVSAHLVVGRDGAVTQLVSFTRRAYHAGRSGWKGRTSLNSCAIGVEMVNWGPLVRDAGGNLASHTGAPVDQADAVLLRHPHEEALRWWQTYPAAQVAAVTRLAGRLVQRYGLAEVLGHDDIAPGRKTDPGPAWDMESIRKKAFAVVAGALE